MCTIMGATGANTRDGRAWIASTSDNPYAEGPRKPVLLTVTSAGRRIIHTPCLKREANGDYMDLGSDRGLTDAGLAWTRSWVAPSDAPHPNASGPGAWFMRLGQECATVTDALAFLNDTPKSRGCQGNYILADSSGALACVEVSYRKVVFALQASPCPGGAAVRTNRFEHETMRALDNSATENPVYYETSPQRQARATHLLETFRTLGLTEFAAILGDTQGMQIPPVTEHGPSICSLGKGHGTVSAEIIQPAAGIFHYTYGWTQGDISAAMLQNPIEPPLLPWGHWRAFHLDQMDEPGAYTTWEGELTSLGQRFFSSRAGCGKNKSFFTSRPGTPDTF